MSVEWTKITVSFTIILCSRHNILARLCQQRICVAWIDTCASVDIPPSFWARYFFLLRFVSAFREDCMLCNNVLWPWNSPLKFSFALCPPSICTIPFVQSVCIQQGRLGYSSTHHCLKENSGTCQPGLLLSDGFTAFALHLVPKQVPL